MTIFQPRREHVSTCTLLVEDLKEWAEQELVPKAKMAFAGEGEYIPGEWCTFCRAAVRCRARAKEKLRLAQMEFRRPPLLTDAEIEDILGIIPDLTKWANEITACPARTIKEEDLHAAVVTAVNDIWSNRKCVIQTVRDNILAVIDNDTDAAVKDIDGRIQEKQKELLDAGQDQKKIDAIGDEILKLREERQETLTEAARKKGVQERLQDLTSFLEAQPTATTEYSDSLVRRLIDTITIYDEKLVFEFKAGLTTEVEI